ncbi:uncharacterized protein LOC130655103 [Hydractinia symbiolongicarpus]|uniref:uncharacterized protein LOC130655103 n=1 Tax=Hydractinia symbiolongicarpus TaxID=13093 RepID=UPI0025510AF9|nr:uncharacterized protein LOC130655103 [Hydractinia symbiolongicarpus]
MCVCCKHYQDWNIQLEVISEEGKIERHPYHVEVESDKHASCGCCQNGVHILSVNEEVIANELYDNICFPLCCAGGDYEWQEKGHFFRLELPSLFIHDGLYVDGKELKSRKLNTSEWKCQFAIWLILGIFMFLLGIVFVGIDRSECCWEGFLYLGISCLVTGLLIFLPGLIGCFRAESLGREYKKLKEQKRKESGIHSTKF